MGARVVFMLTEHQAAALRALRTGRQPKFPRGRHGTRAESILFDRGLVRGSERIDGLELTDLGELAAALADKLAKP